MSSPLESQRSEIAPPSNGQARQGYPLGALFVLTAASAILVAMVAPVGQAVSKKDLPVVDVLLACAIGAGVGLIAGAIIGLHQWRKIRGASCGMLAGVAIGAVAGAICLVPADGIPTVLYASLGGSVILIGVGAALRFTSSDS